MKSKISKILGVGLTLAVMASMLIVATPAAAGTLGFSLESSPSTTGSVISSGDVLDFAVAADGKTIYAVRGTKDANSCTYGGVVLQCAVYKSTNGGASWSIVGHTPTDAEPWYINGGVTTITTITKVAVAPDVADGSVVAIIADGNQVYLSQDGGTTWTIEADLNPVTDATMVTTALTLNAIAFSPAVGTARTLAVGGMNTGSAAGLWVFEVGGFISRWVDITQGGGTPTGTWNNADFGDAEAVWALKFSPNFAGDRTLAVVTGPVTVVTTSTEISLQMANFAGKVWNAGIFGGWEDGRPIETITGGAVQSASLALAPNFLGQDPGSRLFYVGLATSDNATTPNPGGVYRFTDITRYELQSDTKIHSVAVNGAGDKLVAGAYLTNLVYRLASPATAAYTSVLYNASYKAPGGGTTAKVVVNWMGTSVLAGTSGDQAAFAVSTNDGLSFNDISLVALGGAYIKDLAVSADGTKQYLLTTSTSSAWTYVSLWRKDTSWKRVLTVQPAATGTDFVVRAAPENFDVVYLAQRDGQTIYYSSDGGLTSWLPRYSIQTITDMAVESATVSYVLSVNKVSRSVDGGFIWDNPLTLIPSLTSGANIQSLGKDMLLVGGGASGGVSYSTNGNTSWTTPSSPVAQGPIFVAADKLTAGGNIYAVSGTAGSSSKVYRWTIGTSTSWTPIFYEDNNERTDIYQPTGIVLAGTVLYVSAFDGTYSDLFRCLSPATATESMWDAWSAMFNLRETYLYGLYGTLQVPYVQINDTPRALYATVGADKNPKVWSFSLTPITIPYCGATLATTGRYIESFTDTLTLVGPTPAGPADKAVIPLNTATGMASDIAFQWKRLATSTEYGIQIALDSTFTQLVYDDWADSDKDTVVDMIGPNVEDRFVYQPDTTYYWRVRTGEIKIADEWYYPWFSQWSAVRSFKIGPLEAFVVTSPAKGAYDVPIKPTFVWVAVAGATTYELVVSEDPTFAIIDFSRTSNQTYFQADEELAYGTTYYWRVRAAGGAWTFGVFTTMEKPTPPGTTEIVITQPPVTTVQVNVPPPVEAVPSFLLWIIVAIGAILVIALIVLIVRTRRAA